LVGFTSKGLVILPAKACYIGLHERERNNLTATLETLPRVFKTHYGIDLYYFNTNAIYGLSMPNSMTVINCLCRGDVNYLNKIVKDEQHYGLVTDDGVQFITDEYDKLRDMVHKKHITDRDMSVEQRMAVIEKRELELAKLIARDFKLIISFESDARRRYDLMTTKSDGRIVIMIKVPSMVAKGYLSGENIGMDTLMNKEWAYKPVYQWEC
jgi:hypothetical protein